jgi:glutamine---fructose-6-phosphate transaminase (isomerizing)
MTSTYLSDLLDQPEALQSTLDCLKTTPSLAHFSHQLRGGSFRRVLLTGMGSSLHGLYPLELRLIAAGHPVYRLETSELIHHCPALLTPDSLIVAVSQSGQSAEVVQLLSNVENTGNIIGVTNTAGSVLAVKAGNLVLTDAGPEVSVSCKTYISGLAALTWLGDELVGEQKLFSSLLNLPQLVADYYRDWQQHVSHLSQLLSDVNHLFILGRGPSLAAAYTGALVIKEAARYAAEGMSSAAFRHGPLELIAHDTFTLIYLGGGPTSNLNNRLAADIRALGGQSQLAGAGIGSPPFGLPNCPEAALPILEILPAQMISLALAEIMGIEAGHFMHTAKVTSTE